MPEDVVVRTSLRSGRDVTIAFVRWSGLKFVRRKQFRHREPGVGAGWTDQVLARHRSIAAMARSVAS